MNTKRREPLQNDGPSPKINYLSQFFGTKTREGPAYGIYVHIQNLSCNVNVIKKPQGSQPFQTLCIIIELSCRKIAMKTRPRAKESSDLENA